MGLMGAGKSYVAVNRILRMFLEDTNRPIYTNLPIELDALLLDIAPRNPARREAYRERITFAPSVPGEVCEVVNPENGEVVGTFDRLLEFWYFTEPNSVVILDECSDLYSTDQRNERPATMVTYLNHVRHYKEDVYFFLQDASELDPRLRKKVGYVWVLENSTMRNIADVWMLRGLKWPVQFFFTEIYLGTELLSFNGSPYLARCKCRVQQQYTIWPRARGFKNYRSFSATATLPGKATAKESDTCGEFEPGIWPRVRDFFGNSGTLLAMLGGIVTAIWLGIRGVYALAGVNSSDVGGVLGQPVEKGKSNAVPVAVVGDGTNRLAVASVPGVASTNVGPASAAGPVVNRRLVWASGQRARFSDGSTLEVGGTWIDSGRVRVVVALRPCGVECADGESVPWADVLVSR